MKIADVQTRARKANATMDEYLQRNTYMQIDDLKLTVNKVADDEIELSLAGESPEENALVRSAMAHANDGMTLRDGFDRTRFALSPKAKKQIEAVRRKPRLKGEEAIQFAVDPNAQMPEGLEDIDLSMFSDRVKGILEIKTIMPHRTSSGIKWIDENGNPVEVDTEELRTWLQNDPDRKFFNVKGKWWFIPSYWRKEILGEEQPDRKIELKLYRLDIAENLEELEYRKSQLEKSFREIPLPYGLEATLFEHQKHGYLWMNHLYEKQSGGLLADDMGLGKTLQVITFFLHLHNQNQLRPSLVVLPKALVENWQNEIRKFAPALSKGLYIHAGSQRLRKKEDIEKAEIIITNYDTLRIDQLEFGKIDFKVIACDEAQNIKSASGQRSHAMRAMKAEFRLAMTGTPVETKLEDLWTIMDFVSPGFLGSLREFNQLYVKPNNTLALRSDILEIYLRRTKKEVLSDQLPTKHPAVISRVPATELQVNLGQALKVQMEDPRTDKDHANKQTDVLEVITKMRQLYSHPNLILPPSESIPIMDTNKMQEMIRICREIRQKGEKVLLFTEFLRMQDILQEAIYHEFGIQAPIINGKTINRTEEVARFNKTIGFNAMILSPKAAGVGLNITSANHVIHFTRWWNPAVENQATDRVYRIGQNRDVYVYHIITEDVVNYVNGTVENHIHDLLDKRQSMADDVIVSYTSDQLIVNELKQKLTKSG
jgi:SNF2 family DNA or RNA helicase